MGDMRNTSESAAAGPSELQIEELLWTIPHRHPLLMLDRVLARVPRVSALGAKLISGNDLTLRNVGFRFSLPATFLIEGLVQLGTVVLVDPPGRRVEQPRVQVVLVGVPEMQFQSEVSAGDTIFYSVHIERRHEPFYLFGAKAILRSRPVVEGKILLRRVNWV